jgi:hypothetical protein
MRLLRQRCNASTCHFLFDETMFLSAAKASDIGAVRPEHEGRDEDAQDKHG